MGTLRSKRSGSHDEHDNNNNHNNATDDSDSSYSYGDQRLRDMVSYSYDNREITVEEYEYEDREREHDYDRYAEKSCCTVPKLAVFFLFLGLTFGLVFGLVDLDRINNVINGTNGTSVDDDTALSTDDDGGSTGTYPFMQCPPAGECYNNLQSNFAKAPHELMWAMVHNANHDDLLVSNNKAPLEQALEAGYSGLMIALCLCDDG